MPRLPGGRPGRALQRAISQRVAAMSDPVPPVPAGLVRGAAQVPALDPAGTGAGSRASSRPGREDVPYALRVAASWSWRLGIVFVVVGVLVWLLGRISLLVIPLMIAGLLASLLAPVADALRRRVGNGSAVALTVVGFLVLVGLALSLVGQQFAVGFNGLWEEARTGTEQALAWLSQGPLQLTATQINQYLQDVGDALQNNSGSIVSGALSFGTNAGQFAAGVLLTLFALIFFLADGARIWRFVAGLAPARARAAVDGAGRRGWSSMASYVRIQMLVAFVDAVGIGVGAAIIGVPLALPLSVLVFLGSFIPIVGALATGSVAVLLALVANGWVNALIMLAVVLVVQQVEGHILQPLIMGPAVALHPLAVVLAVAGGTLVAGIPGALFSVPLLAVANTVIRYIAHRAWEYDPALTPPGTSGSSPSPHTLQEEMTT